MLYIITSPHVYSTLQAEIDRAILESKISSPVVTDNEARELPYLQAVVKEGFRIFPPGTGLMAKQVPPGGDKINGAFVPAGTKIGVNMWALLRRKDVFGVDSEVFRPERWLEASAEDLQKMETVSELVWGYGKYVCLGKSVALIELNKIFVEVNTHREASFEQFELPAAGTYMLYISEADRFGSCFGISTGSLWIRPSR
jgi:cytochrome P450